MGDNAALKNDWPAQGFRQRIGSRIERHVMRSAVDMLDERGAELDKIEQDLVRREADIAERLERAESEETQLQQREARLVELGARDLAADQKIDHLIRALDETEAAALALRDKAEAKVLAAEQKAQEAVERARRLEDAEHHRVLSAADITRRESAVSSRERDLRAKDEELRQREQTLQERFERLEAVEQDARKRLDSLERMERELEEREHALRGRDQRWWGADLSPS